MSDLPKLKTSAFRFRVSPLDATVWFVIVLLVGALVVLTGVSDPTRREAQIAYLSPAMGGTQNIWLAPLSDPSQAAQITQEKGGVYNFDVSTDGRFIVYAARDIGTGMNELFLLDLQTHRLQAITNCAAENADCSTPAIKSDGKIVAYERMAFNGAGGGPGAIRIWLVDLTKQPYTTRPLTNDSQFVGHSPQWAQSGDTLVFYSADVTNPGIMVYNFIPRTGEKSLKFIPASNGVVGTISPNGRKLAFPDIVQGPNGYGTVLKLADLDDLKFNDLTPQDAPVEDTAAAWHPDGQRIAIERRYSDNRHTSGFQIYLYDPRNADIQPLAYDAHYSHGFLEWNKAGDKLLYQRFALNEPDAKPQVGVSDVTTGQNTVIVLNAFHPRWVQP